MSPRGGKRPGAGRPRTRVGDYVTTSIELPLAMWEWLGVEAVRRECSKSQLVRQLIAAEMPPRFWTHAQND